MTTDDMIFTFCANGVFVPWIALIAAPKWKYTTPLTHAAVLILCVVYTYHFGLHLRNSNGGVMATYSDMGTLDGLHKIFSEQSMMLPAWVHYLAFDLIIGHSLVQRNMADSYGLSKLAMAPCLVMTCLAGPVGVLLYLAVGAATRFADGKPVAGIKKT